MYVNNMLQCGMPRRTAAEAEETRRLVLETARAIASRVGCDGLSLDLAAREAGVTRGAVYHHFGSKEGLCRELIESELQRMGKTIEDAADAATTTWDGLVLGCRAFLSASQSYAYQRIVLADGPSVLGPTEWRALDDQYTTSTLVQAFAELATDGPLPMDTQAAAAALSGAMNELSRWIADGNSQSAAADAIERLLKALLPPGPT